MKNILIFPYLLLFFILSILSSKIAAANPRNIKLVAMNGNQYWFSISSPYAPTLNFHLAYQYCRTLGLQLVTLETREEVDIIAEYLLSIEGKRNGQDYWTSGNRIGSGSSTWIWLSSGEQLNSSFSQYWLMRQNNQNAGAPKDCMTMRSIVISPSNRQTALFTPEQCDERRSFICEQVRCLYYNYPVSPYPDPSSSAELNQLRAEFEGTTTEDPGRKESAESRAVRAIVGRAETEEDPNFPKAETPNFTKAEILAKNPSLALLASQVPIRGALVRRRITLRPIKNQLKKVQLDAGEAFEPPITYLQKGAKGSLLNIVNLTTPRADDEDDSEIGQDPEHPSSTLTWNFPNKDEPHGDDDEDTNGGAKGDGEDNDHNQGEDEETENGPSAASTIQTKNEESQKRSTTVRTTTGGVPK